MLPGGLFLGDSGCDSLGPVSVDLLESTPHSLELGLSRASKLSGSSHPVLLGLLTLFNLSLNKFGNNSGNSSFFSLCLSDLNGESISLSIISGTSFGFFGTSGNTSSLVG